MADIAFGSQIVMVQIEPLGGAIGVVIIAAISATLYSMLHAPSSRTDIIAKHAAEQAQEITGNVLVVFSAAIHSEVLMALAARMAKGRQADLVAIYVIEVPYTLPIDAELQSQEREALEVLTAAEEIGRKASIEITTRTVRDRQTGPAVIQAARDENASLIVMGTYREHRYAGAPLGLAIDYVLGQTQTDVLIGVSSANESVSMLNVSAIPPSTSKGR
ncbi:MAG: universal stress protein [Candidatus Eremiobacteraeota bacterium]|nr:universal stress protein [Candidatus Eremiobacteraeota bacterium]